MHPSSHDRNIEHEKVEVQAQHFEGESCSPTGVIDTHSHYDNGDEEPEIHLRTYIAIAAMFIMIMVQVIALQGPLPCFDNDPAQVWIVNSLSLIQAVIAPVLSSASDVFQTRKSLLIGTSTISFVGAAIAPGSRSLSRLIAAQGLIGFGFSVVPVTYCIPSEILPRKWRPMAQAGLNVGAALGACLGPLTIGSLTKADPENGWRKFYWIQFALWGAVIVGIWAGYRPPKRVKQNLHVSLGQKIAKLDLIGLAVLAIGLSLLLAALNIGGVMYSWTNARVLSTLLLGIVFLIIFGLYEWKVTTTGVLHHDLFRGGKEAGRTFSICVLLIFIEGILLFAYAIFFPALTTGLFESDPLHLVAREQAFWLAMGCSTVPWAYITSRLKTIREPLFAGFLIYTGGMIGFATIQPGDSTNSMVFSVLSGIGFGAPLILLIAGVQLSVPHPLIATATAVITSARAVAATVFTAIFSTVYGNSLTQKLPSYIARAALKAGLPEQSLDDALHAALIHNQESLQSVKGMAPSIQAAISQASQQATADSLRLVFIIAAPFGALACLACLFLGTLGKTMDYKIDAPVEDVVAKRKNKEQGV